MATVAETRPTMAVGWDRYTPLAGVLAVAGWVASILILDPVTNNDTGAEILADYQGHDGRILLGGLIWLIATALFLWWLGALRTRLLEAEGGPAGRLSATAFAGGVATAVCLALVPGPDMAGAINEGDLDESAASALGSMGDVFFIGAEYLLPVLLTATALVALRSGWVMPRWFAWITLLIALVLLIGPIGWAALVFAFPLWVLAMSFLLWRAAADRPMAP